MLCPAGRVLGISRRLAVSHFVRRLTLVFKKLRRQKHWWNSIQNTNYCSVYWIKRVKPVWQRDKVVNSLTSCDRYDSRYLRCVTRRILRFNLRNTSRKNTWKIISPCWWAPRGFYYFDNLFFYHFTVWRRDHFLPRPLRSAMWSDDHKYLQVDNYCFLHFRQTTLR